MPIPQPKSHHLLRIIPKPRLARAPLTLSTKIIPTKPLARVLALLLAAAFTLAPIPAFALEPGDRVISINPSEQIIDLTPGERYEGAITVQNAGRLAFKVTLSAAPYHVNDSSYDPDFSTDNSYTALKNWLSFPESDFILEPGRSAPAQFIIDTPTDIPGGGQYAAIMVEATDVFDASGNLIETPTSTVNVHPRLAAVLYAHIEGGELRESASLTHHTLPGLVIGDAVTFSATIENDGNVDFFAAQTLSIRNFFTGAEILRPASTTQTPHDSAQADNAAQDTFTTAETPDTPQPFTDYFILLPGTSRTNIIKWDLASTGTFPIGLYRLTQTITFLDHEETFERLLFICPVWLALLIVFLVALAVVWLLLSLTKRLKTKRQNANF